MKKLFFLLFLLLLIKANFAQTGLNFQGVARTNNNVILASQPITIKLSIIQGSATGIVEYSETRKVNTNAQGLFTAIIGDTGTLTSLGNFTTINWRITPKFLKIEMDPTAGNNFITMGTTQFQYVAYAQFAKNVDAENIVGIVPVTLGGTGVNNLISLKNTLQLDKINNTADLDKPISLLGQAALDLKLNKADTNSISNRINLKANLSEMNTSLALKANTSELVNAVLNKVDKASGKDLSTNDFTTAEKTKLAAILGNNTGDQDLSAYATTSALSLKANTSELTAGLLLKENESNKSTAADLGGTAPSNILYPTQKAVKDYVTANTNSGGISDGGITTIKLADLAVTDAKVATGINKTKVGLGNVENTALSTWVGTNNITTVGTITTGAWSGTTISVSNGGTGATTAAVARANLGLTIGTNVQAPLTAGIDYQIPLTAGTSYIVPNSAITAATKTKITYDTKGLITAAMDATTADIAPSTDRNYVTDAQKVGVLSNTTGINTGDETIATIKTKLGITTLTGSNSGDQTLPTLASLGAVPNTRTITINGTSLDLSADRSYTVSTGLTLTDLQTANIKAKTFELTQPSSINSTSTTTLDLSTGNILQVVLTRSTTLAFSNPKVGTYLIKIKQDATGNWALAFPSIKWADAAVPTITTTANAIDLITLIYDGVDYYASCLQNF